MARDMVQVRRGPRHSYSGPDVKIGRSQFNRSHGLKTTFDASYVYPILVDEVLPGDTVTCKLNGFARIFSPLDAPVMDNIELETFFFFVPCRLLWSNWEYFMGANDSAGPQTTDFTIPVMNSGVVVDHAPGTAVANLAAYMGLPHGLDTGQVDVNVLPFRAYSFIHNEWFRDQAVGGALTESKGNGPDTPGTYIIFQSAKKHDYFTSATPYLQKGDPVSLAFESDAIITTSVNAGAVVSVESTVLNQATGIDQGLPSVLDSASQADSSRLYADLQNFTGLTVNALRESVAIQRLLERDARGGTRYTEKIKSQFNVTSPDYRLQRPEYLGGGKSFINITPVANTSDTASADQGELRGIGTGVVRGHGWVKSFTEHGYIIGLVRARGDITYFQGLDRMWSRSTQYDFYVPALANLGEQSILNKELYVSNSAAIDDAVFGYQERWAEYRTAKSRITGKFNPDVTGSLSHWHLAEDFGSLPVLNTAFVRDQTPMSRITTVDTEPDFLLDVWFDYRWARPMPVYSIPALVNPSF